MQSGRAIFANEFALELWFEAVVETLDLEPLVGLVEVRQIFLKKVSIGSSRTSLLQRLQLRAIRA